MTNIDNSPPDRLSAPTVQPVLLELIGSTIGLCGDWHGNGRWADYALGNLAGRGVRTVIQLGDFGFWHGEVGRTYLDSVQASCELYELQLYVIDGNHENFDLLTSIEPDDRGIRWLRPRIAHLPRGLRWNWLGIRFLALGGATSLDVLDRTIGESWWPQEAITAEQHAHATAGGPADVLLCHDSPAGSKVPGLGYAWRPTALEWAMQHRRNLRRTVDAVGPVRLWHGHFHVAYQDTLDLKTGPLLVTGLAEDGGSLDENVAVVDLEALAADVTARRRRPGTELHGAG